MHPLNNVPTVIENPPDVFCIHCTCEVRIAVVPSISTCCADSLYEQYIRIVLKYIEWKKQCSQASADCEHACTHAVFSKGKILIPVKSETKLSCTSMRLVFPPKDITCRIKGCMWRRVLNAWDCNRTTKIRGLHQIIFIGKVYAPLLGTQPTIYACSRLNFASTCEPLAPLYNPQSVSVLCFVQCTLVPISGTILCIYIAMKSISGTCKIRKTNNLCSKYQLSSEVMNTEGEMPIFSGCYIDLNHLSF